MLLKFRLALSLLILLLVSAVGTVGYVVLEDGMTLADALYMTVITVSMVGYEGPTTPAGKMWSVAVIFFGVAAVALAFASLQGIIVSGELRRVMGRRRLKTTIEHLKGHIIICGHGRMGQLVASELSLRGVHAVVIEVDPAQTAELEEQNTPYVLGDAAEETTLLEAGLMRARALVATLPSDADNVFVTLTARSLREDLLIVARAEQSTTEPKLKRAGADRVICPQVIGGLRMSNIITRPHVVDFAEAAAAGVELEMDEHLVTTDSPLRSKSLLEAQLPSRAEVMVVAIRRKDGTAVYNPGPEETVEEDDTLIMIGRAGASKRLEKLHLA